MTVELFSHLPLDRPLISLDIEATGHDAGSDRIVVLGAVKFIPPFPLLGEAVETRVAAWQVNPERTMSDEVIAIHGITNEQAATWQPFREVAPEILAFIDRCDLVGFDLLNNDVPMLWEEFYRAGIEWDTNGLRFIDVANIFKKKEERSLSAAVQFYLEREHTAAHQALGDAAATAEVLNAQLRRYPDLQQMSLDQLTEFSHHEKRLDLAGKIVEGPDGRPVYTMRRVRGVAVEDDISFAMWMLDRDFPEHTKMVIRKILDEISNRDTVERVAR